MLQLFHFLAWLAPLTSAVLLAVLWSLGELTGRSLAVLTAWFLLAVYGQFFAGSPMWGALGLLLQTLLAAYLLILWKLSGIVR